MSSAPELATVASEVHALRMKRPGRKVIYPKSLKKKIADLVANGHRRKDIQSATGVSSGAIDNWSRAYGPDRPIRAEDMLPISPIAIPPKSKEASKLAIQLTCLQA